MIITLLKSRLYLLLLLSYNQFIIIINYLKLGKFDRGLSQYRTLLYPICLW